MEAGGLTGGGGGVVLAGSAAPAACIAQTAIIAPKPLRLIILGALRSVVLSTIL